MDSDLSETTIFLSTSSIKNWLAFSLLPKYTETVKVSSPLTRSERILASFTVYRELKEANMDSHFERVFIRLQLEWTYMGGLVCPFHLFFCLAYSLTTNFFIRFVIACCLSRVSMCSPSNHSWYIYLYAFVQRWYGSFFNSPRFFIHG